MQYHCFNVFEFYILDFTFIYISILIVDFFPQREIYILLRADAPKNQKNQGYASERVSSNFLHFWFKDSPMEEMKFPQKIFCPDTPLSALRPGDFFR